MSKPNQYKRPTADEWHKLVDIPRPKSPKPPKPAPPNKRPRTYTFSRVWKYTSRTAAVIAISVIFILALVYVWPNLIAQEPASSNPARLPSDSPTNQPTTRPPDTPATFRYPTEVPAIKNPTAVPTTATRSPPTSTQPRMLWRTVYIEAFASCGNRYQGEEQANRRNNARSTIEGGWRTPEELKVIVEERCPGAITAVREQSPQEINQHVLDEPNPADPIIEIFARCNGRYDGNQRESRRKRARSNLDEGHQTLAELKAVVTVTCPKLDMQLNEFAQPPYKVQRAFEDGTLQPSHEYEFAACYVNPHNDSDDRQWLLFSDETEPIDGPVLAVYFEDGLELTHGICHLLVATYSGPIEWRACRSQPYGANCTPTSTDFLWEKEIPAFHSASTFRIGRAY